MTGCVQDVLLGLALVREAVQQRPAMFGMGVA